MRLTFTLLLMVLVALAGCMPGLVTREKEQRLSENEKAALEAMYQEKYEESGIQPKIRDIIIRGWGHKPTIIIPPSPAPASTPEPVSRVKRSKEAGFGFSFAGIWEAFSSSSSSLTIIGWAVGILLLVLVILWVMKRLKKTWLGAGMEAARTIAIKQLDNLRAETNNPEEDLKLANQTIRLMENGASPHGLS